MNWEPQPWWLLLLIPVVIVLVFYGSYLLAGWDSSIPHVIDVHIVGPIHIILDKAPQ